MDCSLIHPQKSARERGSALILSLIFIGVLISLGVSSFIVINNKYRAVYQAASWHEALLTAEAGIDTAVTSIRKELWDPNNQWAGWSDGNGNQIVWTNEADGEAVDTAKANDVLASGGAIRIQNQIVRAGEGGNVSLMSVRIDAPDSLYDDATDEQWYRIRSWGICDVPGGRVMAGTREDAALRKLNLNFDRITGNPVTSGTANASRMIEAIVRPRFAFERALEGERIDLTNHNILVDSWDSRDEDKFPGGFYPSDASIAARDRRWNGNIAATGSVINAGGAHIYGQAATNEGDVLGSENVMGNDPDYPGGYLQNPNRIRNDFYDEMIPVIAPNVAASTGTPSSINGNVTIVASTGVPTQVNATTLSLSGQSALTFAAPRDAGGNIIRDASGAAVKSYVQLVIDGNVSLSGQGVIRIEPGVHVRLFVKGDADITGNGFANVDANSLANANRPANLQIYGVDRARNADGSLASVGTIKIAGNGGFSGTVYAPNYDVEMKGGGNDDNIYGAFVGRNIMMNGVQAVHYDEALGHSGLIVGYSIVSWFEDER